MKICPVGAKLFHVDGQRDTFAILQMCLIKSNKPKNDWHILNIHKYVYE